MIGFSDDDALAAEYALGTLDHEERVAATERRGTDSAFNASVRDWEVRLAPLSEATGAVQPPSALLANILARLELVQEMVRPSNVIELQQKIRVWRSIAAVASALAAALAVWIAHTETWAFKPATQTYVAVLQQGTDTPSFIVSVDLEHRRMAVMPLGAKAPPDKSFELWMIGGDHGTPQSLGIVDASTVAHPDLPHADSGLISNATYAVTLEPRGGSPTGKPTGAPIFTGKLLDITN